MTHFEYDLAFRAVIGLAGCAMAIVAVAMDWREMRVIELNFVDEPVQTVTWTTGGSMYAPHVGETTLADLEKRLQEPKA